MKKSSIRFLLFSIFTMLCIPAQAEITSLSSAINKSGRQRMLSQRILKTYSMIGIDVNAMAAQQQLQGAITLFDTQLGELTAYASNKKIKKELAKVSRLWKPYKAAVTATVTRSNALDLLDASQELLSACHKVVLMFENLSTTNAGHLVNVAGRQRMLSQRMSMLYMLQTWGFDNSQIRSQMSQDRSEFKGALTELREAKENTKELKKKLRKGKSEWRLFKHGLDGNERKPIPYIVNLAGDKLLNTMNDITRLYSNLNKK